MVEVVVETAETESVTVWRGAFEEITPPPWWQEEIDSLWPVNGKSKAVPLEIFGEADGQSIEIFRFSSGRGYLVSMDSFSLVNFVWCETQAAMLDLMTSRAAVWMELPNLSQSKSLEHIRNAIISIARRGVGNFEVSKHDGRHERDG